MHHKHPITRVLIGALLVVAIAPAAALGISRDAVMARGKVWVDKHVAYSQTRWAKVDGTLIPTSTPPAQAQKLGYRTDCSGFVSMCLGLTGSGNVPLSLTTRSFTPSLVTTITKSALMPGDVMLKRGTHVMIFAGWVDAKQTQYTAYEERGVGYGCVKSTRVYDDMIKYKYVPYRYTKSDDPYLDCQRAIYGSTCYDTAAAASRAVFPATSTVPVKALVVTNSDVWSGNLAGVALAGAVRGPMLITGRTWLTPAASTAIQRLKPKTVYVIGDRSMITTGVTNAIGRLGPKVVRVSATDGFALTKTAARVTVKLGRASGRRMDTAYLVGSGDFADGLVVAPIAARVVRPILVTTAAKLPVGTITTLKATGIKHVVIIGGTSVVGAKVVAALGRAGIHVTRIAGTTRSQTAHLVANHGIALKSGLSWRSLGIGSLTNEAGVLPCAVAQGQAGSLLLLTPPKSLDASAGVDIHNNRTAIGKVRIFGDYDAVQAVVRTAIAALMRAKS